MRTFWVVPVLLLAAACGSGDDSDDSGGMPACDDVWVVGETLPEDYEGCMSDPDTIMAAVVYTCDDGAEFTSYDDRLFAKLGGEIGETQDC